MSTKKKRWMQPHQVGQLQQLYLHRPRIPPPPSAPANKHTRKTITTNVRIGKAQINIKMTQSISFPSSVLRSIIKDCSFPWEYGRHFSRKILGHDAINFYAQLYLEAHWILHRYFLTTSLSICWLVFLMGWGWMFRPSIGCAASHQVCLG